MSMYSESLRAFLKPVLPFLDDPAITEIMINAPDEIWIERGGKVFRTDIRFTEEGLMAAARNMAQFVGRVLSDERPRLDARLPDGSRIHVVLPPVARRGPVIAIRKFFKDKLAMSKLIELGAATPALARLIEASVRTRLNIIVAGGTGSGKTTLLNVVSRFIPEDERIITIEDSAELQLQQPHIVPFESRPPDKFGKGEVSLGDLLTSSLRLRPDRIVVGEVRGGEAFFLLQAMNTGHGGSLATTHANTPTDTLRRVESLCLMSGIDLPMVAIRAQVASAINLVVCCERFNDGSRKITHVSEVLPLNDRGEYRTQDLFVFTVTGKDADGRIKGYHAPTGVLPTFLSKLAAYGYGDLDESFFDPATYRVPPPKVFHADEEHRTRWAPSLRHRESGQPDPEQTTPAVEEPTPEPVEPAPETPVFEASENAAPDEPELPAAAAPPPVPVEAEEEPAPVAAEPVKAPEPPKPPPRPLPRPPPPVVDEPSIQISADLLEEVGRAVSNDATQLKRNPLLDRGAAPTVPNQPVIRAGKGAQLRPATPAPPARKPETDEKTDPHIRIPSK